MNRIKLDVLENRAKKGIVTFGLPWEKGKLKADDLVDNASSSVGSFRLVDSNDKSLPLQSRITAYWPDSTTKWSSHTSKLSGHGPYYLEYQEDLSEDNKEEGISIKLENGELIVDAGRTKAQFKEGSNHVIEQVLMDGKVKANYGQLQYTLEERLVEGSKRIRQEEDFYGRVDKITVEEEGPLQSVIRVDGVHVAENTNRESIPFIIRFHFAYDETHIKIVHTFIYDGDANKDFMKAIGITFDCPISGELYNRHIKISGENGVFHEASQLLVSWRPRLPEEIYPLQNTGAILTKDQMKDPSVAVALADIPVWDSYRLYQNSADNYSVKKGTGKEGCAHINSVTGTRAGGLMAAAGEDGGIALGMKDFWQKFPSSLWIDNMAKDSMKVTAWIWSYESDAMDFRHYDDVGHASSYYEGFDEVLSDPYGIANTNELVLFGYNDGIPSDDKIKEYEQIVQKPVVLRATPEHYHNAKAFGEWGLINRSSKLANWLEDQLDKAFDFYKEEIDQRKWYGLFDYGDFMHTYDKERNNWRYDMGGYAWQNTELVPTLWLWYAYLRTGREDIFTVAEAMTRHCSEVDTYHIGDLKGLGSRHNVLHWGCSCKEARIGMAGHNRFYFYMMGDHRMGDVLDDVKDTDFSTLNMDPLRHFFDKEEMVYDTHARVGPDWSSYTSNWMTAWERYQDQDYKNKILTGINDIKKSPYKLASGSNYEYDPETSHLRYIGENPGGGSHLVICMGGPQVWFELADMLEDEEWNKMLADYGVFYFDSPEDKAKKAPLVQRRGFAFPYMAASMGAYGAQYHKDEELGQRIWDILRNVLVDAGGEEGFEPSVNADYLNTDQLKELPWLSTNFTAQWCLNVIVCLELIKEYLPEE